MVKGVQESFSLARDEIDATLHVAFRMDDEASRIRVNRWEFHEVGAQLVANAVEAMGAAGRNGFTVARSGIAKRRRGDSKAVRFQEKSALRLGPTKIR